MTTRIYVVALLVTLIVSSLQARATSSLGFGISSGGVINLNRASKPLVGRGITVTGLDYGSEYLPVRGGYLKFTTGKLISSTPNEWIFGGTGTITVTGCVDWNLDHDKWCDKGDYSGALLTGTFVDALVINERNGSKTLRAFLQDEINPKLAQFLGIRSGLSHGELDLSFTGNAIPPHAIHGARILSGYLKASPVPEPSSLPLFGSGLAAIGILRLRRLRQSSS